MATNRTVQQVIDLQNRITELAALGRLDLLTDGEVALISYALGHYAAGLQHSARVAARIPPMPPMPRAEPRSRLPRSTLARDKAKAGK
jgi:hypothetical protein